MIETIEINAVKTLAKTRRSWLCPSGKLGTVEELSREYYIGERGYTDCLIDTACVYGGLMWVLFHDMIFHDNLNSKQPLCRQFLNSPKKFYEINKNTIERRLLEYQNDRKFVFEQKLQQYCAHPFFCDPKSKIAKYHGNWLMKNKTKLKDFISLSVEHSQESFVREIFITSNKGRNKGWPDLVAWSSKSLVFAEVKSTDKLSTEQRAWISDHENNFRIELVKILNSKSIG